MNALLTYLKVHVLVWLIPLTFLLVVLGGLAWKVANTPDNPFIYNLNL
ncbi:MAG: hypothetical protein ACI841_001936 [Planctomycetota bacterium]|jgi:hypothetical protein